MRARLLMTVHIRERRHPPFSLSPGEGNAALTCYSDNISQSGCSIWTAATGTGGNYILLAHCAPRFRRMAAQKTLVGTAVLARLAPRLLDRAGAEFAKRVQALAGRYRGSATIGLPCGRPLYPQACDTSWVVGWTRWWWWTWRREQRRGRVALAYGVIGDG